MVPRADYEGPMAAGYDAGRGLTPATIDAWAEAVRPLFADRPCAAVLDLGAGTGRFSGLLHEWTGADVVAVEPADAMRRQLAAKHLPGVRGVAGAAGEALPFRDETFDAAWLSQVVHHFDDLGRTARELARVVRGDGRVLIRGVFGRGGAEYGRTVNAVLYRYFPAALEQAKRYVRRDTVLEAFESAGFEITTVARVPQVVAESLADYCEKIRVRADSTLAALDDAEFEEGLQALERAARGAGPDPVVDELDLLVLSRGV